MVEKCWCDFNAYSLAFWGVCTCVTECELKAQIVDLLLDVLATDGPETAKVACELVTGSVPGFRAR